MSIIADFDDEVVLGDPGEYGSFENEPYDGLQESLNTKPSNWRINTTPEEKKEILLLVSFFSSIIKEICCRISL